MNQSIITLLTDFGLQDGYVGTMKGVIFGINPAVSIVDVTHEISPQNVEEAAYVLRNTYSYFPPGTIHVVVVDPGVGTGRPAIIVETDQYRFIGPDNGVFAYVYQSASDVSVTQITNTDYCLPKMSQTFHGRDVFAPVAAHLSNGVPVSDFGSSMAVFIRGEVSTPVITASHIRGHVLHIDRFGNVVTDIPADQFAESTDGRSFRIEIGDTYIDRLSHAYGDVAAGEILAVMGSAGLLEISINGGDAAQTLGIKRKTPISIVIE